MSIAYQLFSDISHGWDIDSTETGKCQTISPAAPEAPVMNIYELSTLGVVLGTLPLWPQALQASLILTPLVDEFL